MRKVFNRTSLLVVLLCVCLGMGILLASNIFNADADYKVVFEEITLTETASLGEQLDLPSVEATVKGNKVKADCCVYTPRGEVFEGESILFENTGRYVVEYSVVSDNVKYKSEKYIQVYDECFSFSDAASTLYYGEHKTYSGINGLNVELSTSGRLLYNAPIEMEGKTKQDDLISFTITPQIKGEADCNYFYVKLEDIYNPDNNITVQIQNSKDSAIYILASANNSKNKYGLRPTSGVPDMVYEGKGHTLYKNGWGTYAPVSFASEKYEVGDEILSFSMDYAERQLFFRTTKKTNQYIVFDFDDLGLSDINFKGFESGRAFLSFYATGLKGSTANVQLKTVDGFELSKKPCAPVESEIKIDAPEVIPHAVVGSTYPCFDAQAFVATNNEGELFTSVYYSYYSQIKSEVPVVNSRFTVKYEGLYTIEYMVKDKFGNRTIETIDVQAVKRDKLSAEVSNDSKYLAGVENVIPNLNVNSSYGEENVEIKVFGKFAGEEEFEIKEGRFVPDRVGEYVIKYQVSDFADTIFVEHKINVENNDTPIFLNDPVYDEYIIANASYKVIPMTAVVYVGGHKESVNVTTKINRLNERKGLVGEGSIQNDSFAVSECAFVEIIYTATYGDNVTTHSIVRPVINVGYGDKLSMEKYFVDKIGRASCEPKKLELRYTYTSLTSVDGVGRMQFARDVVADKFESTFGKLSHDNIKLNVYLRDRINEKEQIKLTYYVLPNNIINFLINDQLFMFYNKNLLTELTTLTYSEYEKKIVLDGTQYCTVKSYMNGEEFTGFSSNYIYMEIELEGIETDTSFSVGSVCNQVFGNYKYDSVKPYYSLAKNAGLQLLNTKYTIEPTYFADVLDPNITYSMTVYMPDKSIAKSVDGIELKNVSDTSRAYEIMLSSYGDYAIRFTVTDFSGNCHEQVGYSIIVKDTVSPTITLANLKTEVKVGEVIEFPEIIVSDDITAAEELTIFVNVYAPTGIISRWNVGDALVIQAAGEYVVQVFCYDLSNNTASYSCTLTVK